MESKGDVVFDLDTDVNLFQGGQLKNYSEQWSSLGAPKGLTRMIKGYTIPFGEKPSLIPFDEKSLQSFHTKSSPQMDKEIAAMLKNGVIKETQVKSGFLSSMFLIPKPDGSSRPIFNLKRLNDFLLLKDFHLISHYKVPSFLQNGDFLLKIDLSQAYFHVPIKESHQRFLASLYRDEIYCMVCLPFGLASAPQAFASLTNWVASYLRDLGIRVIVYLDDFLIASQDEQLLLEQGEKTIEILQFLGWKVNFKKSQLHPQTQLEFLGITWNPTQDIKFISQEKRRKLKGSIKKILDSGKWSWELAMSIIGELSFVAFVVPLGRLHCRRIQRASHILPRELPSKLFNVSQRILEELKWWTETIHLGTPIFPRNPQIFITTDASNTGWGAHFGEEMIADIWSPEQMNWHINRKDVCSKIDHRTKHQEFSEQECFSSVRQQDCSGLHKQGGRHKISGSSSTSRGLTDSDTSEKHFDYRQVHSRNFQFNGRQSFPEQTNPGLALVTRNSDQDLSVMGCTRDRSICNTPVSGSSSICSPIGHGSTSVIYRRIQSEMDLQVGLDFSSPVINTESVTTSKLSKGSVHSSNPKVAQGILETGLEKQSYETPYRIRNLEAHLIDTQTNLPPPQVKDLYLEAWRIRGGSVKSRIGEQKTGNFQNLLGENPP